MVQDSVSIAMGTYNGQRFLQEQLASLALQSVPPLELVVCDDRSTDDTYSMLEAFAQRAPFPVRLLRNDQNIGYRLNFVKAASLCRGSLISFCDQDDIWHKDKVARVLAYFSKSDALAASHDFSIFYDDGKPPIRSYFDFLRMSGFSPAYSVKGCATTFRTELIDRFGWPAPDSRMSHDTWVCLTAALARKRTYLGEKLIEYRKHGHNSSGLVLGGEKRLARFLRGLTLPPFTSKDELDVTLGYFIPELMWDQQRDFVRDIVLSAGDKIAARDRRRALAAVARAFAIRDFVTGDAYARAIPRAITAVGLFLRLAYRNGDGVQGLLLDILGRRG